MNCHLVRTIQKKQLSLSSHNPPSITKNENPIFATAGQYINSQMDSDNEKKSQEAQKDDSFLPQDLLDKHPNCTTRTI